MNNEDDAANFAAEILLSMVNKQADNNENLEVTLSEARRRMELLNQHPAPWYLDTCNDSAVCVKDNRGNIVLWENLGSMPAEIKFGSVALARWLVSVSETWQ